jgi:hypothetical protein
MHRLLLIFGLAALAFAQTGQITGLVSDPAGTSVPGAAVAVTIPILESSTRRIRTIRATTRSLSSIQGLMT